MNENQNTVISLVMMQISPDTPVVEELIEKYVEVFSMVNPLTQTQKEEVIASLHSKLSIRMDRGSYVKEKDHATWYYSSKKNLKTEFWERYRTYLFKEVGFNSDVTNTLDIVTDDIMDLLGNPKNNYKFQRRGLIIGDVQSGKTATYTNVFTGTTGGGVQLRFSSIEIVYAK